MHGRKKLVFVVNTMNHRINVVSSLCHSIRQLQKLESPDVDELLNGSIEGTTYLVPEPRHLYIYIQCHYHAMSCRETDPYQLLSSRSLQQMGQRSALICTFSVSLDHIYVAFKILTPFRQVWLVDNLSWTPNSMSGRCV